VVRCTSIQINQSYNIVSHSRYNVLPWQASKKTSATSFKIIEVIDPTMVEYFATKLQQSAFK